MQYKYDVFISHASEDKKTVVCPLAESIQLKNLWIDSERIFAGDDLVYAITEGISVSKHFVVIISKNSLNSRWVQAEINFCFGLRYGNIANNFPVIIPVLHEVSVSDAKKALPGYGERLRFLSTKNGLDQVANEITKIIANGMPNTIIGISGASCSGKSWFAEKLQRKIHNYSCTFGLDGYYKDIETVNKLHFKHDDPASIDFEAALDALRSLKSGHTTDVQQYDFTTHSVTGVRAIDPAPIIIIEGLFVFKNQEIRSLCDVKVWIDSNDAIRLTRRIVRDTSEERDRSVAEVLQRYKENVEPGFIKYISPLRTHADIFITNNGSNDNEDHVMLDVLVSYLDSIRRRTK